MNYLNPDLYNALAAQYVLGTLRGPARRRFSKLIMQNSEISEAVNRWELYLNSLGEQFRMSLQTQMFGVKLRTAWVLAKSKKRHLK